MNILYLATHLDVGGISSYIFTLAKGMKKRSHRVYVASAGGRMLSRFESEGVGCIIIPIRTKSEASPKLVLSWFRLLPELNRLGIDILHANSRVTQVLAAWLNKYTGIPYISTCHGFFRNSFHRRLFPCWGKKVIAISSAVEKHLLNDFHLSGDRVEFIPHGVQLTGESCADDLTKTAAKGRFRKFGLGDGPVVGIVARLSPVKGHRYLIEAMAEVLKQIPEAQLLIAGDGSLKPDLVCLARQLGIIQNIIFLPNVDNTQMVLEAIDVFVLPSVNEGLGLGLMEAMACGLPVVGSRIGGIEDLIQHNVNGLLVEPKDNVGLAEAILGLLKNSEKRKSLGLKAKEFINRNFSLKEMLDKTERVYEQCKKLS